MTDLAETIERVKGVLKMPPSLPGFDLVARDDLTRLLDRIEALEREVRGLYDDKAHDADAIKAGRNRIEALEKALREADPHNAMLPPEEAK